MQWWWWEGGSLVSCLPVFSRLLVRTSEHSLKLETGTKCQVDRSGFLCYSRIRLCGGKICTWWPWKLVLTQATAHGADKLTTQSNSRMLWFLKRQNNFHQRSLGGQHTLLFFFFSSSLLANYSTYITTVTGFIMRSGA